MSTDRIRAQRRGSLQCLVLFAPLGLVVLACDDPRCPIGTDEINRRCVPHAGASGSETAGTDGVSTNANVGVAGQGEGVGSVAGMSAIAGQGTAGVGGASASGMSSSGGSIAKNAANQPSSGSSGGDPGAGGSAAASGSPAAGAGGPASPDAGSGTPNSSGGDGGITCEPMVELCDGMDNDCDSMVDEGVAPMPCGNSNPPCKQGAHACENGTWSSECVGEVRPETETCDGVDNDCSGAADEGCACVDGETQQCGSSVAPCRQGTKICVNGQWPSACVGEVKPTAEVCDGVDNDCNGTKDDGGDRLCTGSNHCGGTKKCVGCLADDDCTARDDVCTETYCNTSSNTCETRNKADRAACVEGSVSGFCRLGSCVECLQPNDCAGKLQADVCQRVSCVGNECVLGGRAGDSCGSQKVCAADGRCVSDYYGACAATADCIPDTICINTSIMGGRRSCYPQCSMGFASCDTRIGEEGLCVTGPACAIVCGECTVDENRVETCTANSTCPSGLSCGKIGNLMTCY